MRVAVFNKVESEVLSHQLSVLSKSACHELRVERLTIRPANARGRCHSERSEESRSENEDLAGCLSDRKSTRLNSSHLVISYAVFCLKKKTKTTHTMGLTL